MKDWLKYIVDFICFPFLNKVKTDKTLGFVNVPL